ncbi:hypothetical protein [Cellulophaga fucicola]|uniref:Tetratricopeptide repeat-containing protein n=1 Tax=Cellulophaga fucicola TaxID=76595 RepID=A0A1K1PPM6_9FLAO|nr:hypothetical protein [Cellulophaga fucicola]SFW49427.1 hypothetical protein SAMN05660313_02084 [Cellulophaga fucicola]
MKQIITAVVLLFALSISAQTKSDLLTHYEAFYKQMKSQGDTQGIINAITHLNVLAPNEARKDTLAYLYVNSKQNMQALRTIGLDTKDTDSDMAVQVRALALKDLGDLKRAIAQFEILNKRAPNAFLAYELADLKIQTGDKAGAGTNIEYGLTNAKDDMKYAFYERQQPYEVSLKAAFLHLKALVQYNNDQTNPDAALVLINEALAIAPNFNLASLSKQAIEARKAEAAEPKK